MKDLITFLTGGAAIVAVVIGLLFGWVLLWGWIAFLTYRSFAPETWPELGLWTATGAVLLATFIMGQARRATSD